MSYSIDRRLLRLAGELLAKGSGTFTAADVRTVFRSATQDKVLLVQETAAILVIYATVVQRADAEARGLFQSAAENMRNDDPDLEPWVVRKVSGQLLRRAAELIAGGKQRRVSQKEIIDLMTDAYRSDGINRDEAMAFLVIRELFEGRMATDAQQWLDNLCAAIHEDGVTLGTAAPGGGGTPPPGGGSRQCSACSGVGYQTCGSCGGYGYHTRSGTRTRYDGSTEYYQERVPCSCGAGRVVCGRCRGSGRL
jgi:hypothetical protein